MRVALVLAALAALAAPATAKTVHYAIIIGNNAPPAGSDLPRLRYADDDAVRFYQLLSRIGRARLLTVLDAPTQRRYPGMAAVATPPTLVELRRAVDSFAAAMAEDRRRGDRPIFYFVFSGHGARDANGGAFLALLDGALTQEVLYEQVIASLPAATSHVIVDACHAGGVVGVRGDFFAREVDGQTATVDPADTAAIASTRLLARFPTVGVLIGTTLGEEAHEWSAIEAGVFSHEVLSALSGAADVNGDGQIEYTEIQAFIAAANRDVVDPRAAPHVIARPPAADLNAPLISLADLGANRRLIGDIGRFGHFFVELEDGQRYLDAHLASGVSATIVLPLAGKVFVRTDAGEAALPAGGDIDADRLVLSPRAVATRGSVDDAYRRSLFASTFGRTYYQGFVDSIGALGVRFPEAGDAIVAVAERPAHGLEPAVALAGLAAGGAIVAAATGWGAYEARRAYDGTDLQRPAAGARDRYDRDLALSLASGGVAIAAGLASFWLWPRSAVHIAPATTARGGYALTLETAW